MKRNDWRNFFEQQRDHHEKLLFTVTELANAACTSRAALNVELSRLRDQGIVVRYSQGLYGMPGIVSPEVLAAAIDSHAYVTGHYALYRHQLVTQTPFAVTCFTDRRSPHAQERMTPIGRFVFVCVRSRVYCPAADVAMAPSLQALCDYVYLARRQGTSPESLVRFRNLARLRVPEASSILARYPKTVQKDVRRILDE